MYKQELIIPGPVGDIEAILLQPVADFVGATIGIVCHPHPLFGGSMSNKVVTTVAKSWVNLGLTVICFNFRGVGKSAGKFADTLGEIDDCAAVVEWAVNNYSQRLSVCSSVLRTEGVAKQAVQMQLEGILPTPLNVWLAGFSFGSYIAAAFTNNRQQKVGRLLSIAPPVHHQDFYALKVDCPWLIIQGEADEVVPAEQVYAWYEQLQADKFLIRLPQAGHFFHGKLLDLEKLIQQHYSALI